jgi:hypothetical protein
MAAISGDLTDQLGIKKETTWGTAVTVDRFFPIIPGDGFDGGPEAIMGQGVYAGKVSPQLENAVLGNEGYKGTYQMEVYDHSQGLLYEAMLGGVSSSGAGPYTRTFVPAEPLPSYTMQEVFADNTGTLRALTYCGLRVRGMGDQLRARQDRHARHGLDGEVGDERHRRGHGRLQHDADPGGGPERRRDFRRLDRQPQER